MSPVGPTPPDSSERTGTRVPAETNRIAEGKRRLVAEFGPWTTPVDLGGGINAFDGEDPTRGTRLRRLVQIAEDAAPGPLEGIRILDLACLEGMVSVELARRGARVLGIEAREGNIVKARFAKEMLGLTHLDFVQDDVRNLSRERYGSFDTVLCLGILYHLPVPDVFEFTRRVAEVTERVAVIDTHVSLRERRNKLLGPLEDYDYAATRYRGRFYQEYQPGSSQEDRVRGGAWSSLDERPSFWPTLPSLLNLLHAAGFTSVFECHSPKWIGQPDDRLTLLAYKGTSVTSLTGALSNPIPHEPWTEEEIG